MKLIEDFELRLKNIEDLIENNEFSIEDLVYQLESDINNEIGDNSYDDKLFLLLKKIKRIKKELDFYDEEAELDMMFPNRHDNDFDEDDMSYDSVFGDD